MKLAIIIYLMVGVVLLVVGFYGTGECRLKNTDLFSDAAFILVWPIYFTVDVIIGPLKAANWLHMQACQGGIPLLR
jgi:hypothetical protein